MHILKISMSMAYYYYICQVGCKIRRCDAKIQYYRFLIVYITIHVFEIMRIKIVLDYLHTYKLMLVICYYVNAYTYNNFHHCRICLIPCQFPNACIINSRSNRLVSFNYTDNSFKNVRRVWFYMWFLMHMCFVFLLVSSLILALLLIMSPTTSTSDSEWTWNNST